MSAYKIAFYVPLASLNNLLSSAILEDGNPGMGGSEYLFLITVRYLNQLHGNGTAVILTDCALNLKDELVPNLCFTSIYEAEEYCICSGIQNLVIKGNIVDGLDSSFFRKDILIYLWAHNTLTYKQQKVAAKYDSIKAVVSVSKSQYENMQDTVCANKCTYINNIISKKFYCEAKISDYEKIQVVYVGSLVPQKGAHNLVEIWKYVEQKVPEAELLVFGGSATWNPEINSVKNTAADKYYNRIICKRLKRLNRPQKIIFMGSKGWDEIPHLIRSARVGIVNPSYYMRDETFCMSAVELQTHGIPIVSRKRGDGLNSTIFDGRTGFLEKSNRKIANRIIELLIDPELCKRMGRNARDDMACFLAENEVSKWIDITEKEFNKENYALITHKLSDAILLRHDFILKIMFLLESNKWFDLLKRKIKH